MYLNIKKLLGLIIFIDYSYSRITCTDTNFKIEPDGLNYLVNSCTAAANNTRTGTNACNGLYAYSIGGNSAPSRVQCRRNVINACQSQVLQIQIAYNCDCDADTCNSTETVLIGVFLF